MSRPTPVGVALASWQVAQATNYEEAQRWVSVMRQRGATEGEIREAWDDYQEAQEKAVQIIHSTPTEAPHAAP